MAQFTSEFNETDFPEFDPTPYGGGYDIVATFGAPLAPSDSICYPHSLSKPPIGSSEDPTGKGEVEQPTIPKSGLDDQSRPGADEGEEKSGSDSNGYWLVDPNFDYSGSDNFSNGYGYGYEYGCGYGYGGYYSRDDLGPCAALFDYWPCLYRKDKMSDHQLGEVGNLCGNQWEPVADYLFGSWNPHGEIRDEVVSYGCRKHNAEPAISVLYEYNEQIRQCDVYSDERYYPDQPISVQYDYNEGLWSQDLSHCKIYYEEERCNEQSISVQSDYNKESWPQDTGHYEVDYEEPYLQPNYGENWYEGYDENFH